MVRYLRYHSVYDECAMVRKKRPERATIYTIAEAASVHPSTASRALSPETAHRISSETADRIRQIASELDYKPHPWARSLRTNRTFTIGVVLPRLTDGVLARMGEAAEDRAREHGYIAVTLSTHDHHDEQGRLVDLLLERRVDGLLLATVTIDDPLLDELDSRQVPFVLMNRQSHEHPSICADDELGGYMATRHLVELGHLRIGMVAGPLQFSTAALRLRGYRRALEEAGISVEEDLIIDSSFRLQGGVAAGRSLLASSTPPSAVFAVNDSTAIGVMSAARELGLSIPEDVALIGYNDTEVAEMLHPPLSSVAISLAKMGRWSIDALVKRMGDEAAESVLIKPELKARESSQSTGVSGLGVTPS